MASTPAQIRTALVSALQAGLGTTNLTVNAYRLEAPPDNTIHIIGCIPEYDQAMRRGFDNWTFQVQALSGSPVSEQAQVQLDAWKEPAGANSVKAAIESDPTLGGVVISAQVTKASGDIEYQFGAHSAQLGCVFDVFIRNTGH